MSKLLNKIFCKRQSFIVGAVIISAGGFISKLLGAAYRIPLTNILGSEGMGIYQMVYPLYCILLTVSASGIPAGVARLISSGRAEGAERSAFRLYGAIGVAGAVLMFLLAGPLAAVQREPAVMLCCRMLSPAVLFTSVISVVRGYFQGRHNMLPTAFTEICEQLLKVLAGVAFALYFRNNMPLAVAFALLAVTISEGVCALFAVVLYRGEAVRARPLFKERQAGYSQILRYTLPITFAAIAMPLSQLFESIVAVNLLRSFSQEATALYGIFSGCAVTIINLPVSVTYGLAAASVPKISPKAADGDMAGARAEAVRVLLITLAVSAPFAAALFAFAPLAARIIFSSLSDEHSALLVKLVRIMAINAVTLSLVQSASACLTALGTPLKSTFTQWTTCVLRVALTALFIRYVNYSVEGAAVAANIAYFVAAALNVWYIMRAGGAYENNIDRLRRRRGRFEREG